MCVCVHELCVCACCVCAVYVLCVCMSCVCVHAVCVLCMCCVCVCVCVLCVCVRAYVRVCATRSVFVFACLSVHVPVAGRDQRLNYLNHANNACCNTIQPSLSGVAMWKLQELFSAGHCAKRLPAVGDAYNQYCLEWFGKLY